MTKNFVPQRPKGKYFTQSRVSTKSSSTWNCPFITSSHVPLLEQRGEGQGIRLHLTFTIYLYIFNKVYSGQEIEIIFSADIVHNRYYF